jgi:hypothetical protein
MMQWKFGGFLQNSSKFKLVEFKSGNTINYTLEHEI